MAKFVKVILLLMLTAALGRSVSDAFTVEAVNEGAFTSQTVGDDETYAPRCDASQRSCISVPQLPYLSDAELTSGAGSQLLTFSRVQRLYIAEYTLSLKKEVIGQLFHCVNAWFSHRSKLFGSTVPCRSYPLSEYYVFMLRRIII